jgi:hypothetical protein
MHSSSADDATPRHAAEGKCSERREYKADSAESNAIAKQRRMQQQKQMQRAKQ